MMRYMTWYTCVSDGKILGLINWNAIHSARDTLLQSLSSSLRVSPNKFNTEDAK